MIRPKKLPRDANQRAHEIAKLLTGEVIEPPEPERSAVSAYLAQIGRKGGLKGGKARAKKLSAKRKKIARVAARARWSP
ncbi:MAG: histone H1 [Acidobacteria bacterium]|nr:MAG: histone H1 [Acidobacteriota bacterium]